MTDTVTTTNANLSETMKSLTIDKSEIKSDIKEDVQPKKDQEAVDEDDDDKHVIITNDTALASNTVSVHHLGLVLPKSSLEQRDKTYSLMTKYIQFVEYHERYWDNKDPMQRRYIYCFDSALVPPAFAKIQRCIKKLHARGFVTLDIQLAQNNKQRSFVTGFLLKSALPYVRFVYNLNSSVLLAAVSASEPQNAIEVAVQIKDGIHNIRPFPDFAVGQQASLFLKKKSPKLWKDLEKQTVLVNLIDVQWGRSTTLFTEFKQVMKDLDTKNQTFSKNLLKTEREEAEKAKQHIVDQIVSLDKTCMAHELHARQMEDLRVKYLDLDTSRQELIKEMTDLQTKYSSLLPSVSLEHMKALKLDDLHMMLQDMETKVMASQKTI